MRTSPYVGAMHFTRAEVRVLLAVCNAAKDEGWYMGRREHWDRNLAGLIDRLSLAESADAR